MGWTPLRLLGPQDRSPRCSPITDQGREPPAEPHKWASRSEIHTQGRATWKCVLGAEISLAANLSKPCLSPGARRALSLSLSVAGVPTLSVDEIAGRGCFTHLVPGSSSTLEAPLPCRPLPRRTQALSPTHQGKP